MKAIALTVGTKNLRLIDRPEPHVAAPDQVKLQVLAVGICGTDREESQGGRALAPDGAKDLIIGHEMLGRVVELGNQVSRVQNGDLGVFTVRRGCARCLPCTMNRSDMCLTGKYRERGIWGLDGYETENVVDAEQYIVQVPLELESVGVLCEPTSVVEKAIGQAVRLQTSARPDAPSTPEWLNGRRCLVAGLGPIGLLGAMALALRGAQVFGLDIVDEGSPRAQWLAQIGGTYIDGRQDPADKLKDSHGPMDLILEAAGVTSLDFNLLNALALDGCYVLTGLPSGDRSLQIDGARLMRQMVLGNQVMVGSVNAARGHYQLAVDDLKRATHLWPGHLDKLITSRYRPSEFERAFTERSPDDIKTIIEWK